MKIDKHEVAKRFVSLPREGQKSFLKALKDKGIDFGQLPIYPSRNSNEPAILSYAQARQWFLWQLEPQGTEYHIYGALKLQGALNVEVLKASFDALIERHESLRTVFEARDDGLAVQVIQPHAQAQIEETDLRQAGAALTEQLQAATARLQQTPFDLTVGPLLRIGLIRLASDEHVLVVVMHHSISDGWSMQIIVNEFVAQYSARIQGEAPKLAPLPIQYADYAIWQRSWLEAGEQERQLAYWKNQLGTEHPVLQLSTDHTRHLHGRYSAATFTQALPELLTQALHQRAQAEGATVFMVLLAGVHALLYRYSGQTDIRVGVPIANRHRVETAGVVGFFVNTQVLRGQLNGCQSLMHILRQAKEAALGAQQHQDLPFEQLVEALQPERNLGVNPLFQVMYNHQRSNSSAEQQLPGLTLSHYALGEQGAQFELTLDTLEDAAGGLSISLTYACELFEAETIARMAGHYVALLQALSAQPELAISQVELLGAAEAAELHTWGIASNRYPNMEPVHYLIEAQTVQRPDTIALIFEDTQFSYAELNTQANRLAHHLISLGVKPEVKVGIALERSADMLIGLLAILKAGGAYVPLDPDYPQDRLAYIVEDSGISLLLTQSSLQNPISAAAHVSVVELDRLDLANTPQQNPGVAVCKESLAYVIYTSGSTGKPKGVGVTHSALVEHTQQIAELFNLTQADRLLQFTTLNFDAFVEQFFPALITGAAVVLRGPNLWDSATFHEQLLEKRISVADLPTAYWFLLVQDFARQGIREYGALRQIHIGGEAMPPEGIKAWRDAGLAHVKLVNTYGPTETTVSASALDCAAFITGESVLPLQMPIGRPLSGRALRVLDADLTPAPLGVAGELYIGGELLARGYLNRSSLSAERFVADPFSNNGGRLYRTGDLVRWTTEGHLEYLGRIDHQVKIRGFRIELGEVEAQLLAQPEVREAVVVAQAGLTGLRLVGYVAGHADQVIDALILRERLGQVLPDYMVPSALVVLEALPLNANGKVDRKALPEAGKESEREYAAPQGELEETLAAIWSDVLGIENVGRHDNFFELGGHSLLALSLLERLRARRLNVQVRTLFQQPQLAAFAQAIAHNRDRRDVVVPPNLIVPGTQSITPEMLTLIELDAEQIARIEAAVPGGAAHIQDIYPLAPLQEGMLFHHMLQQQGDAYVTSYLMSFDSEQRLTQFMASFNQVIARHDILRTAVLWEGLVEPVQVVHRAAQLHVNWQVAGPEAAIRLNHLIDPSHYRIDVRQAPLIRALAAHDTVENRWLLQLPSHHLVLDHTTLDLIVEEIALIQQGRAAQLPEPVPFRRFVAQARLGVSQAEHEAFFQTTLGDVDEPTAPFGLLDVQGNGSDIIEARLPLPPELSAQLRQQAQHHGVSAAAVFHLAWALVLAKTTGRHDVVFGTVLFGRMQGGAGAERAMGLFINTLPLRVKLEARSVLQSLKETYTGLTDLLHHEHASLSLAQRCSGLPGGTPLFSALFNYRYSSEKAVDATHNAWEGMDSIGGSERTNYPVGLSVDDLGQGFELVGQINQDIGAKRLCDYALAAVAGIVEALAHQPQQLISEVQLLNQDEQQQLQTWGVNNQRFPNPQPIHRLIEAQAAQRPHAPAVIFEEDSLTYAELNTQANQLAHHLISLGVQPETKVGIAIERSLEMVVGLLAILKAGGAYVPLDPDYPQDRLAYMLEDSGIDLLLTQSTVKDRIPTPANIHSIELDQLDTSQKSSQNPTVAVHGDNLAYVIYTSGSTGKPKGAQLCHRNVTRLLDGTAHWFNFGPQDVWTLFHSYAFDFSVWEIFGALCTGGQLVIVPFWISRSPEDFLQLLRRRKVTVLNQTPSAFGQLLATPGVYAERLALRVVIFGGEALDPQRLKPWMAQWGNASPQLINMYGITETTVHVTYRPIVPADLNDQRSPVGAAIPDLGLRVLDGALNLAPIGVAGELYVAGEGLARGYLNRAGLSSERFIADPFSEKGERLYRTGDLVRWTSEGQLEYLGRIDHQVKIRGFRIELGEIEAQLLALPDVREVVVLAKEGPNGTRLVGYVSGHDTEVLEASALREHLGHVLPDYMVPSVLIVLDALPLNANGKIDRKALPEADQVSTREYVSPQGELEEILASIWSVVLGVEKVGRHDNFFELGGHSLLALSLLERLRAQHLTVQVRTLFQQPELAAFAQAIAQNRDRLDVVVPPNLIVPGTKAITPEMLTLIELDTDQITRIEASVPGGASNIQDIYPLAPLQEGLLFHHLLQQQGDAYITSYMMIFDSAPRLTQFMASLNRVIARHDILRTAVLWEGLVEPVQVVYREAPLSIEWLSASENMAERLDAHTNPRHFRIDVRKASMIHAVAGYEAAEQKWLLRLLVHHLIDDNTTVKKLISEIALIQQGRASELPEPVPFRRFVAQTRLGISRAEHEAFFTRTLGDVEEPTAPFGLLDVQGDGSDSEEARLHLPAELSSQLRQQAQKHGVGAAALFHLAWALVLAKTSGRNDVVFGTVLFGRMQGGEGADRALGLFINTLPLRVKLDGQSVLQSLKVTQSSLTDLLHHEHASLSLAQSCSGLPGGTPLFSALFNYRYGVAPEGEASAWEGMESLGGEERTNYPVDMSVDDLGDGFELTGQVNAGVGARRLCEYLQAAVAGIVAALANQPQQRVTELQLLAATEQQQLQAWGINHQRFPGDKLIHRLIEAQADQRPQATAVIFEDDHLTYAQLNMRANQLSHHLIGLGVEPDVKVGIAVERSLEMVVGLLAILKAGGTYVPLDPDYPQDRLAHIVSDSGIQLLLTQSDISIPVTAGINVIEIDRVLLEANALHNPVLRIHGENLAYVIYTSGSTGKPKGVGISHRSLVEHSLVSVDFFGLTASDRMLQFATLNFDGCIEQLFPPLATGAAIVLRGPTLWDSVRFHRELLSKHISVVDLTTAYWLLLVQDFARQGIRDYGALRQVHAGGEAMPPEGINAWRDAGLAQVKLLNTYGPTEATVTASILDCYPYVHEHKPLPSQMPIGTPLAGRALHVVDADLNAVPVGVAGELCIGGELLARGYFNRPGLSTERFIADPFSGNGCRLYRTGDLVRWNREGQLEYLGRIDHQVKIRGFRIELGEVEAQLLAQPEVREAVVLAQSASAGIRLVAYVSAQVNDTLDPLVLRERLAQTLPDYMVPSSLVILEALPLNANGKVDRKALPDAGQASAREYVAPQGELEEKLAAIWAEVLGVDQISRQDNFFELGGHSLLAVQIVSRVQSLLLIDLNIRAIFTYPTFDAMASHIAGISQKPLNAQSLADIDSFIDRLEIA